MDKAQLTAPIRLMVETLQWAGSPEDKDAAKSVAQSEVMIFDTDTFADGLFTASYSYGEDLLRMGLLRLPFDRCVFCIEMVDDEPGAPIWYSILVANQLEDGIRFRCYESQIGNGVSSARGTCWVPNGLDFRPDHREAEANASLFLEDQQPAQYRTPPRSGEFSDKELFGFHYILPVVELCGILGLLAAQGVRSTHQKGPSFINRQRAAKGKLPIYSFWWVDVDPTVLRMPGIKNGGSHATPRLHLRRGHIRRLASGALVNVRPCLVGSPELGVVEKSYRVRQKTTRRELV